MAKQSDELGIDRLWQFAHWLLCRYYWRPEPLAQAERKVPRQLHKGDHYASLFLLSNGRSILIVSYPRRGSHPSCRLLLRQPYFIVSTKTKSLVLESASRNLFRIEALFAECSLITATSEVVT